MSLECGQSYREAKFRNHQQYEYEEEHEYFRIERSFSLQLVKSHQTYWIFSHQIFKEFQDCR